MDPKELKCAFYSREYDDKHGCVIWEDENGKEVSATRVSSSNRLDGAPPDEVFAGKVLKFVKLSPRALEKCEAARKDRNHIISGWERKGPSL